MKKLLILILILIAAAAWQWFSHSQTGPRAIARLSSPAQHTEAPALAPAPANTQSFRCDGRTHCSQMTSCAEANYFLQNCPGTKMDGNHDGVPCEKQWCGG